jgi:hypothetical protein
MPPGIRTFVPRGVASAKFTASELLTGQLAGLIHPRRELSFVELEPSQ